jgi:hypothetical protein
LGQSRNQLSGRVLLLLLLYQYRNYRDKNQLQPLLKMIARQKESGFGWKIEDFKFRAAFTIIQHFQFFEKKF